MYRCLHCEVDTHVWKTTENTPVIHCTEPLLLKHKMSKDNIRVEPLTAAYWRWYGEMCTICRFRLLCFVISDRYYEQHLRLFTCVRSPIS